MFLLSIATFTFTFTLQFVNQKKKKWIVHDQGALNINYSIFVFKFDVCQIS